jgi:hypothetical protein
VDQDFAVGVAFKLMPLPFQVEPQLFKIVNFAVKDQPDPVCFIAERLVARLAEIQDREAPVK